MKYSVIVTSRFKKEAEIAKKRGLSMSELEDVIDKLILDKPLEPKYKDHALKGIYTGCRECHINSDWLLIYKKDKQKLLLILRRTGTHSDLF
ncbi:MAG: type II toxin-antitoxin system YafQ family toxin [Synergistaceae bacterium]|nr:type II toxin-antitoxin system YafQ family toxin [Synergistaceae bacterium]MBR0079494.1 type II toxin-antitoxin system YafQ family toxin [Synergistaceae bacterium]MBR0233657.1 type II toxin-antitoxin system YafQ family toxin [Synergistaceae bacterium]